MAEKKQSNKVDRLLREVRGIQDKCKHDFHLNQKRLKLTESFVKGVYVGLTSGPISIREKGDRSFEFTLICSKCSTEKETTIIEICHRCLKKMEKAELEVCAGERKIPVDKTEQLWSLSRYYYFGQLYAYYSVRLYRCPNCGFTVACDEWNQ